MKRNIVYLLFVLFAHAISSSLATAGPVTWAFEGHATLVYDPLNQLAGQVQVGSPLTGQVTFDSEAPGSGFYQNAILDVSASIGGEGFLILPGDNHILAS